MKNGQCRKRKRGTWHTLSGGQGVIRGLFLSTHGEGTQGGTEGVGRGSRSREGPVDSRLVSTRKKEGEKGRGGNLPSEGRATFCREVLRSTAKGRKRALAFYRPGGERGT